jgi:hypothetical protein
MRKRKLLSLLVLLMMAVTQGAWAETIDLSTVTANTIVQNGDVLTGTLDGSTQKYKISIADGATVTLDGVTINGVTDGAADGASSVVNWAGITCLGDATIILKDGTTNTVRGFYHRCPGIFVPAGKTLTIEGPGALNASASISTEANHVDKSGNLITCSPGIGSAVNAPAGNIVINGGTINATGGWASAAIGGNFITACGNITINGGTVNASGSLSAAAIGGGWYSTSGNIEITGGTVTAVSGLYVNEYDGGPGIGCGSLCTGGNITIGGTAKVTAVGGYCAAGIGAGGTINGFGSSCGTITIGGSAEVTATGGFAGAGIGGGAGIWAAATCGDITITGGTINAVGGKAAAGIGGGWNMGRCSDITITGGNIEATGGNQVNGEDGGPGIGGSPGGSCGDITITDATIKATKGDVAPCSIGKGGKFNGVAGTCGTVTIGGTVYADGITISPYTYPYTIYCKMEHGWWTADGAAIGIFAWDDNGTPKAAWPGERMTLVDGETNVWKFDLDVNKYKYCVFARVNPSGDIEDWGAKTKDQTIPTDDKDMFTITSSTAVWGDSGCEGTWSKYVAELPTYAVTIDDGSVDAANWEADPTEQQAGEKVKLTYKGKKKIKSITIEAAPILVTSITLNKTSTTISTGETETLSVTAVAPANATDKTYTWKSSDETKATVDQNGVVTAKAAGTVTIYAEANDGSGVKGECAVTVQAVLRSETITFSGGSGSWTYSGTNFQATGEAKESGILHVSRYDTMVISARTSKTIVMVVFSYNWGQFKDTLSASPGTFDGNATVSNVNATSLTVSSSHSAGVDLSGVTVYYYE